MWFYDWGTFLDVHLLCFRVSRWLTEKKHLTSHPRKPTSLKETFPSLAATGGSISLGVSDWIREDWQIINQQKLWYIWINDYISIIWMINGFQTLHLNRFLKNTHISGTTWGKNMFGHIWGGVCWLTYLLGWQCTMNCYQYNMFLVGGLNSSEKSVKLDHFPKQ